MADPADESSELRSSSNPKWWEQYYVRYFVGTVVGAVILLILGKYSQLACDIQALLPLEQINGWGLTAIASGGLAYCYIASAPILTLHAIRGGLGFNPSAGPRLFIVFLVFSLGIPAACLALAWKCQNSDILAWGVPLSFVVLQCAGIFYAQRHGFREITGFYDKLIDARRNEIKKGTDYIESYRHLREHGNAKSILVLEIYLGISLVYARNAVTFVSILILWIIPAAYAWCIATVLESHFSQRYSIKDT